ncbi:unnamed protein product [Eruca vesicaria subsp. sativa]|uniref:Uncharacterized protein n=1 Tax=Eruca vesicaria subsp. sativa TaxID=29727 RepID=A0ABC8KTW8_ERUVS|nr:unnamed protein product [Eruca vesicaria subsp. sativa]
MKIDVSEAVLCGCDTLSTEETEPSNVVDSSVQPLGSTLSTQETEPSKLIESSDQSSGTEQPQLAPLPVTTTSVNPEPAPSHADASITPTSPVQASPPTISSFPPPAVSSEPAQAPGPTGSLPGPGFAAFSSSSRQANVTNIFGSSNASVPMEAPPFASGSSTASASSTTSPLRWGSVQAPVQANGPNTSTTSFRFLPAQDSGFPPQFGYPAGFARPDVGVSPSGYFGGNNFSSPSGPSPRNPFGSFLQPGFGVVSYPPNPFGTIPQTSSFLGGGGTEQGSRYPCYAPTPDLDSSSGGQGKLIISISASNSHGHKSHEELRWEDYQKGDKGGFGWFPPAHTVSPSLFASPILHDLRQNQIRTITRPSQGKMTGFPFGYTNHPTAVQTPHEPAGVGVSSPASACTVCGATSSSSPSGQVGFNGTTNPPSSAATTLPGLFFSTSGSMPLMFGAPNLAAYGGTATTPAVQAYVMIILPRTTTTPTVQAYPMMFGTPNTTTTPGVQPYPMMFGTPNLVGQGTATTPPVQLYHMMFGTPLPAGQGTTTAPAAQPYAMMFGTQQLAGQGTTTTPSAQRYPMMFGTPNLVGQGTTTTPAVQPYAMMFGTPNRGAQGITPAAQAHPVHGLTLPFAAMSLQ